jgi:hypothetical protein
VNKIHRSVHQAAYNYLTDRTLSPYIALSILPSQRHRRDVNRRQACLFQTGATLAGRGRDSHRNGRPGVRISGSRDGCVTLCVVCGYPGPRAVPTELSRPTFVCVRTMEINPLKTKLRLISLKTQLLPRSKQFSSGLKI